MPGMPKQQGAKIYGKKAAKSCKNMRFWAGNVRHGLSANQTARYFKLKKPENYMKFHIDFLHVVR